MMSYLLLRCAEWILAPCPYWILRGLGRILGSIIFWTYRPWRKKAMTNLAIAFGETLTERQRRRIARRSFQNVCITLLEMCKIQPHHLSRLITLHEPEKVTSLQARGQGIVFLTGHQANWEFAFLAINMLSPGGVAVGRPIKNRRLYRWILSKRQMNGGKIISPRQAIKEGLRSLRQGKYIGIVGDQALPESDYSYPLFGTRTWISTAPALLAYRTGAPLIVGVMRRVKQGYELFGSDPLWPDTTRPMKEEVPALMNLAMKILERDIHGSPDQWLWIHDRWKQQTIDHIRREYRYAFVLVILPQGPEAHEIQKGLTHIYPRSFLTFVPEEEADAWLNKRDWRYQLVLDFVDLPPLRRHFLRLGAVQALPLTSQNYLDILVKPECLLTVSSSMPS